MSDRREGNQVMNRHYGIEILYIMLVGVCGRMGMLKREGMAGEVTFDGAEQPSAD